MADYDELTLTSTDGVKVKAFLIKQPQDIAASRPTVLLLHANAGNVVRLLSRFTHKAEHCRRRVARARLTHGVLVLRQGHRLPIAKVFWKNMRCNVLALSYRGSV